MLKETFIGIYICWKLYGLNSHIKTDNIKQNIISTNNSLEKKC